MRLLVTVIAILGFFLFGKILMGFLFQGRARRKAELVRGKLMVRDPVCDTFIPRDSAIAQTIQGETVYFCSEICSKAYAGAKKTHL